MKLIPFKKRILYYLALLPISMIAQLVFLGSYMLYFEKDFTILAFIVMYCVFGVFFLKMKLKIKIIVAFIVALISYFSLWLIWENFLIFDILYGNLNGFFVHIPWVLISIIIWEITYQILKIILKK